MAKITLPGDSTPNSNGYEPTVTNQGQYGDDFNGDWPSDGFILPGCATVDQGVARGQFVAGSNGRKANGYKGG